MEKNYRLIGYITFGIILKVVDFSTAGAISGPCSTPTFRPGSCIPLSKCDSLLALLQQQQMDPMSLRFLQDSTCDRSTEEPSVCCPLADIGSSATPTTIPTIPPTEATPSTLSPTTENTPTTRTTPKPTTNATTPQPTKPTTIATTPQPTKPTTIATTPQPTKPTTIATTPQPTKPTTPKPTTKEKPNDSETLLPGFAQCGNSSLTVIKDDASVRIAGGTDAGLGSFPWMVLIGYSSDDADSPIQYSCGGSLINSKYILTASHCVAKLPEGFKPVVVRLGEYDQKSDKDCDAQTSICAPAVQDMIIQDIIPHESYDVTGKKENDIALIRLKKYVKLGPFVSPICLPSKERLVPALQNPENLRGVVAGWGRTTEANPEGAKVLQRVEVPIVKMDKCNALYKESLGKSVDAGRFCAGGEKGHDSCQGDSGGPLMRLVQPENLQPGGYRFIQLGVVSLGPKYCDTAGQPALYSNVAYFMPWIKKHLKS